MWKDIGQLKCKNQQEHEDASAAKQGCSAQPDYDIMMQKSKTGQTFIQDVKGHITSTSTYTDMGNTVFEEQIRINQGVFDLVYDSIAGVIDTGNTTNMRIVT